MGEEAAVKKVGLEMKYLPRIALGLIFVIAFLMLLHIRTLTWIFLILTDIMLLGYWCYLKNRAEAATMVDEVKKSIAEKVEAQEAADSTEDPVFTSAEIPLSTKEIQGKLSKLSKRPKPKVEKKEEKESNTTESKDETGEDAAEKTEAAEETKDTEGTDEETVSTDN